MSITNNNESNVADVVIQVLTQWLGRDQQGEISTQSLKAAVASSGADPAAVDQLNMGPLYAQACENVGLPTPPYHGPVTVDRVVREVQEVHNTYEYNYDDHSQNNNFNQDLSGAIVEGDVTFDPIGATGGSVAGGGDVVGATGGSQAAGGNLQTADHGSTLIGGDNFGNANSGANAAQVGGSQGLGFGQGDSGGPILERMTSTGMPGFDGSPINISTGSGDQTVATTHGAASPIHFGAGDDTTVNDANLTDSAIGHDGVFGGNTATDGSAIGSGNEVQHIQDEHTETYTSTVTHGDGDNSPTIVDQGAGEHHDDASQHVDLGLFTE